MKYIYLLLFLILCISDGFAQEGMHINQLFDGRYKKEKNATEVLVKGRKLESYQLTLFRSLTVKDNPEAFRLIRTLVDQDAQQAIDKESGRINGKLYYGFYQFKPHNNQFRYLFFRDNSCRDDTDNNNEMTIVYMEGNTTIEELKNLFK